MVENNRCDTKPKISRTIQAKIGRELRTLYEDLVREPLPENLLATLRALDEVQSSRQRLKEALKAMRRASRGDHPNLTPMPAAKRA